MEYLKIANSPWMWLACGLCAFWAMFQATLFVRKSLLVSKELNLNDAQIKSAMKSSLTASIGPAIAIVTGIVPVLVAMGGPVALFRESYIGSVAFELMAAGFGAEAMGVTLGSPDMNEVAFACGLWVMVTGSTGWILFTALATPKLDKFRYVLAGGRKAMLPIVSAGAMCGAFSYLSLDRVFRFNEQTTAAIAGFVVMSAFMLYNKKHNKQWIKEWSLTISMFVGMFISAI
ncbi:MAG TPA: DUF5058 family protein [Syntrophomonas sp.]|nr:DUF5058 family protein [Syntrophomonas sp.]